MDVWYHILMPISRWLHIVATTLLVGGTLFYEFVVPPALEDLKDEHQAAVFGRVRWIFRKVVWFSAIVLIITGAISTWRLWHQYNVQYPSSKPWWVFHVGIGVIAIAIALRLTMTWKPPVRPLAWMRINMVILLVIIYLASSAQHVRLALREREDAYRRSAGTVGSPTLFRSSPETQPTTLPATLPTTTGGADERPAE